jgi:hypothetical protein
MNGSVEPMDEPPSPQGARYGQDQHNWRTAMLVAYLTTICCRDLNELAKLLRLSILKIVQINAFDFDRLGNPNADIEADKQSR